MATPRKPVEEHKPAGKPKRVDFTQKATLDYVRELAANGMFEKDIARCLGNYSAQHFAKLKTEHPELAEALKSGQAEGIALVTAQLMQNIRSRDNTAIIFYLKCKAGWRDNAGFAPESDGAAGDSGSDSRRVLERVRKAKQRS